MLLLAGGRYFVWGLVFCLNASLVNLLIPSMMIPILGDTQELSGHGPGQPAVGGPA